LEVAAFRWEINFGATITNKINIAIAKTAIRSLRENVR
jgi:hypothetical protein